MLGRFGNVVALILAVPLAGYAGLRMASAGVVGLLTAALLAVAILWGLGVFRRLYDRWWVWKIAHDLEAHH